jgi:3-mercaptopyruvate sulfurtransferase SseA
MITRDNAIRKIHPNVFIVNGEIDAYDKDGNKVELNEILIAEEIKKLQAEETAKQEAQVTAKQSAMAKLSALGLTADEVKALLG